MQYERRILVLGSDFSGSTSSLIRALRKEGCKVTHTQASLRVLPRRNAYLAAMVTEAIFTYGRRYKSLMRHTRVCDSAMTMAMATMVRSHPDTNMVIQVGRTYAAPGKHRQRGVTYTLFTDHTNLLSKNLPDYGVDFPERHTSRRWNEIERVRYGEQDHIFVMGRHVKQSMIDDYGLPAASVTVVGAGPNLDVDIERDRPRKDYAGKNILFVGFDAARKGLDTLKKAFCTVREVHADAILNVVGINGPSGRGVEYRGKLFGEPLKQLFYDSQIFVLPSVREPFGIVLLEAMWSKAVCIGSSIEAMPEIIKEGETGYLVAPNDEHSLADRLMRLLSSPDELKRMADSGYSVARVHWRWDRVAKTILDSTRDLEARAYA